MKYCKGTRNGKKCKVTVVSGEFCRTCKAAIDAGEDSKLEKPVVPAPVKTVILHADHCEDILQMVKAGHVADAGKLIEEPVPTCLACEGPVAGLDLFCHKCIPDDFQISPVALTDSKEQATTCFKLSPPLAALVEEPEPPLPDTAIVLDLGPMYETLVGQGVGSVTILELLDVLFIGKTYGLVQHGA